jgi:hypothetical protein
MSMTFWKCILHINVIRSSDLKKESVKNILCHLTMFLLKPYVQSLSVTEEKNSGLFSCNYFLLEVGGDHKDSQKLNDSSIAA